MNTEGDAEELTVVHLISNFVMELLDILDVSEEDKEQLQAKLQHVETFEKPEDMLVHLSYIAQRILNGETDPQDEKVTKPTPEQNQMMAAKMTLSYIALLC